MGHSSSYGAVLTAPCARSLSIRDVRDVKRLYLSGACSASAFWAHPSGMAGGAGRGFLGCLPSSPNMSTFPLCPRSLIGLCRQSSQARLPIRTLLQSRLPRTCSMSPDLTSCRLCAHDPQRARTESQLQPPGRPTPPRGPHTIAEAYDYPLADQGREAAHSDAPRDEGY